MTGYHGESRPVAGHRADPGSNAVHYDKEPHRRPAYHAAVGGGMPGGYAAEDGAALHFVGRGARARRLLAAGGARLPRRRAWTARWSRRRWRREYLGAARRRGAGACRLSRRAPRGGARRRRSSRWAAAGSRWSRRTRRSTTTCSRSRPAREPRICLLPTAGGDSEDQIRRFHAAFGDQLCEPTHVSLFRLGHAPGAAARAPAGAGRHLRRRRLDGQPARALARARARRDPARGVAGRDRARRAQRGLDVLVRVAASRSGGRAAPARGLGFLPGSNSVHYDGEPERRPVYLDAVAQRRDRRPGWGVDDGVGLLFRGTRLAEVVALAPGARAYRVAAVEGEAVEEELEPRLLKAPPHADPGAARRRRDARAARRAARPATGLRCR